MAALHLELVASTPDFFAHAGDAPVRAGMGFGCECARCGRAVSAPFGYERALIWCLYCDIDEGHVPAIESQWTHQWSFGVAREEAREEREWLEQGRFYERAEDRARRAGRVIDVF